MGGKCHVLVLFFDVNLFWWSKTGLHQN